MSGSQPVYDIPRFNNFLNTNNLNKVFPLLIYELNLIKSRAFLIDEAIQKSRNYLVEIENNSNVDDIVLKLHGTQLDLISKVFMIMEDYLSYSYYIRNSLTALPELIAGDQNVVWKEINSYLQNINKQEVIKYLSFPDLAQISALDQTERKVANDIIDKYTGQILNQIRKIITFHRNYNRVYNKYKHIFSALIGTHFFENNKIEPILHIRDYHTVSKNIDISTYVIPSTPETLDYYKSLKEDIFNVFTALLSSQIYKMLNCGQIYLIPQIDGISDIEKRQWSEIVNKIKSYSGPIPKLNLRSTVTDPLYRDIHRFWSTDFIYKRNIDILDTGSISISDKVAPSS
jgi:hypothetical protein